MNPGCLCVVAIVVAAGAMASRVDAATITIVMDNLEISPAEASARVGDTIHWVNNDVFAHTATATNGDFDLALPPKATVTQAVAKAGGVDYYCRYHPNMKARINIAP